VTDAEVVRLEPFTGSLVAGHRAQRVVAPPYDALRPDQREAMAAADPDSFLGVLPPGGSEDDLDARLRACRASLERLLASGAFRPLPAPALALVTITDRDHRLTALVGDVEVAAFNDGRVRPHEATGERRVADLARYLEVVGVASSPVAVVHRPSDVVAEVVADVLPASPDVAFVADDGAEVTMRVVTDAAMLTRARAAVAAAGPLYVADGHHRADGVARFAAGGATAPTDPPRTDPRRDRVLTAVLPADQLRVLPFHRRVDGVALSPGELERWLAARGLAGDHLDVPTAPDVPGTVTVTDGTDWWRVDLRDRRREGPVASLDVRTVERELLEPLVAHAGGRVDGDGKGDGAGDVGRIEVVPVAPTLGLGVLARPGSVGVALAAPPLEAVLAVADAGETMPAKSTYVTPKLRSGLLLAPR
jgi:uncharacterized protein (DUF1015 family)